MQVESVNAGCTKPFSKYDHKQAVKILLNSEDTQIRDTLL